MSAEERADCTGLAQRPVRRSHTPRVWTHAGTRLDISLTYPPDDAAVAPTLLRSSGTFRPVAAPRSPRRTCIRTCRCVPLSSPAADRYCSTRSWVWAVAWRLRIHRMTLTA